MGIRNFPVVTIGNRQGKTIVNAAAAGSVTTIPLMEKGVAPKFVFIQVTGAAAAGDFIGVTPSTGAVGDIDLSLPLISGQAGIILSVHGYDNIGYEASTTGMELRIMPLEDF